MTENVLAITAYPLSRQFQAGMEGALDVAPVYASVPQLRRLPPLEMVRTLRRLRADRCLLPLEDMHSRPVVPILHAIAALSAPTRIELVDPDFLCERLPVWTAGLSACRVVAASVLNARTASACRQELQGLLARGRIEPRPGRRPGILYLNSNVWFGIKAGGSVGHIAGVANGLARAGYDVELAAISEPPLLGSGVRFAQLRPPATFGIPYERNKYRFQRDMASHLERLIAAEDAGLIYERMSISTYAGVRLSRSTGLPLILEYNGSEAWVAQNWGAGLRDHDLAVMAEDVCLRHAHLIVTVSEILHQELLARGVPAERIVVYPNCIDPEMFDPARFDEASRLRLRRAYGISPDATVVAFLGTFGQWHGVEVLAKSIRRLVEEDYEWIQSRQVRFMLIGDGLKAPEVDEILSGDERCAAVCSRTGLVAQAEAPGYIAATDVVVSPHVRNADGSDFFGSPTKLFEYMAMAKPIVASDLDQIGVVLRDSLVVTQLPEGGPEPGASQLALLTQPGDVDQVARGIKFMVDQPDWRITLGDNARREALARYTWDHHVRAILDRATDLGLAVG